MDGEAWRATVCGVTKSQTWLSNWAQTHAGLSDSWGSPARSAPSVSHDPVPGQGGLMVGSLGSGTSSSGSTVSRLCDRGQVTPSLCPMTSATPEVRKVVHPWGWWHYVGRCHSWCPKGWDWVRSWGSQMYQFLLGCVTLGHFLALSEPPLYVSGVPHLWAPSSLGWALWEGAFWM